VSAAGLAITPEAGRRDRRAFLDLPWRLYRGHPTWVGPLRMSDRHLTDRKRNPFFAHADAQHFLARRGRRVVGRVAAIENRLHNEFHGDRAGFFGFFDVEPDPEAARGLVEAARAWTEARGLSPMIGPVCYSTNDTCGVLVEGFEHPPVILMPWNRPDYDALLEGAGLVAAKDLLAFLIRTPERPPDRFARVVERRLERAGIRLRPLDLRRLDRELPVLRGLYNRSWERNWGFVPATDAEFDAQAKDLKAVVDRELSAVAEQDGTPVGFSLVLHDLNHALRGGNGRLFPTGLFRILFRLERSPLVRIVALGVVPEARGRGVNEAFFVRAMEGARRRGIVGGEAGWVLADNERMQAPILAAGGVPWKRYRLYRTP
jgi:GNAT superfamily N-acetyltransferase